MPHNIYLHSALVKSREIDRTEKNQVKEANLYFFIESGMVKIFLLIFSVFFQFRIKNKPWLCSSALLSMFLSFPFSQILFTVKHWPSWTIQPSLFTTIILTVICLILFTRSIMSQTRILLTLQFGISWLYGAWHLGQKSNRKNILTLPPDPYTQSNMALIFSKEVFFSVPSSESLRIISGPLVFLLRVKVQPWRARMLDSSSWRVF